ncbi:unnamed protein product [Sphagnum jensenii]|uniref:WRKY domain-containing protein n=1 Tax=Sphagnum jensenii TaxID=128206 RepID=A0ABP1BRK6_9BRYO
MLRLGGGNWSEAQCVEKVEEMLSRAIIHQEDLWGMLMLHSPAADPGAMGGPEQQQAVIPSMVLRALMAKLENSMDWCHLALCRLKEILSNSPCPPPASLAAAARSSRELAATTFRDYEPAKPIQQPQQLIVSKPSPSSSSKLKQHTPLSQIHVPLREESLASSPHPLTAGLQPSSCFSAGESGPSTVTDSPWSYLFRATPKASAAPPATRGTMNHITHQGQQSAQHMHFVMNSESSDPWNCTDIISQPTFTHKSKVDHPGRALNHLPRETSFSCRVDAFAAPSCLTAGADAEAAKRQLGGKAQNSEIAAPEGGIELGSTASHSSDLQDRSRRNTVRPKREREATAEEEKSEVQYQRLRPGLDAKKGIPDDGHRGWKKYGNKAIQNANFCRGYYKCSIKNCNAKKMVQPTDKDPSIFQVTYVGKHTCSSAHPRKRQPRANVMAGATTFVVAGDQAAAAQLLASSSDPNAAADQRNLLGGTVAGAGTPEITDMVSSMDTLPSNVTAESLSEQWQVLTGPLETAATTTTRVTMTGGSDLESVEGRGSTDTTSWSSDDDWKNFASEDVDQNDIYSYFDRNSDEGVI